MATVSPKSTQHSRVLRLNYSGRIIDHLGLQTYQSPVAAVAEIVANAWDADADRVELRLPKALADTAEIVVGDDGNGMTFAECQHRFLNVGLAGGPRRPARWRAWATVSAPTRPGWGWPRT